MNTVAGSKDHTFTTTHNTGQHEMGLRLSIQAAVIFVKEAQEVYGRVHHRVHLRLRGVGKIEIWLLDKLKTTQNLAMFHWELVLANHHVQTPSDLQRIH